MNISKFPILLLHSILVFQCLSRSSCAREIIARDHSKHDSHELGQNIQADHPMKHMHEHESFTAEELLMEPQLNIFFTVRDLKVGKTIPIYFSTKDPSTFPRLLSKEEADSIPFSSSKLPYLLKFFSFSQNSPQARAMKETLHHCEAKPMSQETKICVSSLESLLGSVRNILGTKSELRVFTTVKRSNSSIPLQNYTICEEPEEIVTPAMLPCHTLPYPYAVFYCHRQGGDNRLFRIPLVGETTGERVDAIGVCHMDSSEWQRDHVSFRVLRIEPGSAPVCHFFPTDNLVFVSSSPDIAT